MPGVDRAKEAQRLDTADIDDAPASRALRVRRARAVLGLANDAVSRASAMQVLAKLVGVGDAMLILGPTGKLRVQTWRDVAGFTSAKEVGEQKPLDLLTPLAPPRPKPPKIIPIPIIPIEQPRWYEDRRVQVGTAAAVVIAVLVSILWVRSSVDFKTPNDMIGAQ